MTLLVVEYFLDIIENASFWNGAFLFAGLNFLLNFIDSSCVLDVDPESMGQKNEGSRHQYPCHCVKDSLHVDS